MRNVGSSTKDGLAWFLLLGCWGWLHCAEAAHGEALSPQRPNVLMIIVDDLNDWVGCLGGHPGVQTPHLDQLAKRGVLFTNAHVPSPVCNPSRVAVLTGRMPATSGVYDNKPIWHEWMPHVPSIPSHFKASGYQVYGGGQSQPSHAWI